MMAAILAFVKGLVSKAETDISTVAGQIGNLQQSQFTCKKNGGTLQFSCSNTTSSVWLITVARGTGTSDMGAWIAVCGSTSALAKDVVTAGANVTLAFDSTSNKLTLTNGDTTNDLYVSAIRLYGNGTLTGEQA